MRFFSILLFFLSSLCFAENIKIAIVGPMSEKYEEFGQQLWQGALQASYNINVQDGINGSYLELIKYDDKCSIEEAKQVAEEIIKRDDIKAVIGHFCSDALVEALPIYQQKPNIIVTPTITLNNASDIIRMVGNNNEQAKVAVDFILSKLKRNKIALFHDNSAYGKDLHESIEKSLKQRNVTPKISKNLDNLDDNLKNELKEKKISVIYYAGYYDKIGELSTFLHTENIRIPLFSGDTVSSNAYLKATNGNKNAAVTFMTFGVLPKDMPENKFIIKQLKDKVDINGYTLHAYSGIEVIADALKNTDASFEQMKQWIRENTIKTAIGNLAWDENGYLKNTNYKIYIWDAQGHYFSVSDEG